MSEDQPPEAPQPRFDVLEVVRRAVAPNRDPTEWRESAQSLVRGVIRGLADAAQVVAEAMKDAFPPNWATLTAEEIEATAQLMREEGLSLAWTPNAEVIKSLLEAEGPTARGAILVDREPAILVDLNRLVSGSEPGDGREFLWAAATEALEAYRSGFFLAAQSLAAAVLTTLIHDSFGHARFDHAREAFSSLDPDEQGVRVFRASAVLGAVARTIERFEPGDESERFSRHGTAHWVVPHQYTQAHSLTAVMLAVSFLLEVEWLQERIRELEEQS